MKVPDLGGSNFRTVRIVLEGNGNYTLTNKKFVIPKEAMQGNIVLWVKKIIVLIFCI